MNKGYKPAFLGFVLATTAFINAGAQDVPSPDKLKIFQDHPMYNGIRQSELRITGDGQLGSNVFNADFLLSGINDQVIDDNYDRLNRYTRTGFTGTAGIRYTNCNSFLEDSSLIWFVGLSTSSHFGVEVSQDLFKLALRGNKQFAGQEIEFGNSGFNYYTYDKATFGLNGFKDHLEWEAGLSIVAGRDFYTGDITTGNLLTSEFGDSINGSIHANWDYTNGNKKYNGFGLGLDLSVGGEIGTNLFGKFSVTDLGFVRWNHVQQHMVNSNVDFEGFYYTFDRERGTGLNLLDSLSEEYISKDSGSLVRALPMRIRIELNNMINPSHFVGLSVDYVHISGYEPVVSISHHWFMTTNFALETNIGYGAFGSLRWKEKVHFQFGDKVGLSAGIIGLEGLLMKDMPLNGGAFFEAAYFM